MTESLKAEITQFLETVYAPTADYRVFVDCVAEDKTLYRDAVALKHAGYYLESAQLYIEFMTKRQSLYLEMLLELFKTTASGGALVEAGRVWQLGIQVADTLLKDEQDAQNALTQLRIHGARFANSIHSETDLRNYLMTISGNPAYVLPAEYVELVAGFTR
ncbi:hypothetical protein HMPREF0044_0902 [Gleimia coleocanis DSM 15436]|uniref:Uncharacterized protein n=1 Tax=Gleimia coleocanis DSM 15436 TaxID=525245 RepID=C0W024_9ACTO|nr:hypothetical protein [Gleimia coleocanis]EEH63883.1 hypothetical protein HMPREF0044_0902 [Gleimia coleocanis DSM 15436]